MIITRSYFTGLIHIPNATNANPNSTLLGTGLLLDGEIETYERELLIKCLGVKLFNRLKAHVDATTVDVNLQELIDGSEYEVDGITYWWKGLIYSEKSFIADYIYYNHVTENKDMFTGSDVNKKEPKNSTSGSGNQKLSLVWRNMYKWIIGGYTTPTIIHNISGTGIDWVGCHGSERSLYQFLQDMNDIDSRFSDWQGQTFENINSMGI